MDDHTGSDPSNRTLANEFTIDLMNQWENETLVLVHLAKVYKGLNISKRKSTTGRNIIQARDNKEGP